MPDPSLAFQPFPWYLGKGSALLKQGIFRSWQAAGCVCLHKEPNWLAEKCGEAEVLTHPYRNSSAVSARIIMQRQVYFCVITPVMDVR